MDGELYIIRLIRKIIRDEKKKENEVETATQTQGNFFATDYFDIVKTERVDLHEPFTKMMGIWPNENLDVRDVSVQSYSLYCSAAMLEKQGKSPKCGNPFGRSDTQFFLSIIQVHITPELIAHGGTDKGPGDFMSEVFQDLFEAVLEYAEKNSEISLSFRIYKMLSAGDFAVVVRSQRAETSFQISTALRRRVLTPPNGGKKLILYKTYTLLTLGDAIISQGEESQKESFVLRCCYSNLYWSDKEKTDRIFSQESLGSLNRMYGLNGRYDFSIYMTENEFLELFPAIKQYKETGTLTETAEQEKAADDSEFKEITAVQYMKYLMSNRYLSYINERYLIAPGKREQNLEKMSFAGTRISMQDPIYERKDFMDQRINALYEEVWNKYRNTCKQVNEIRDYHKNMLHNVDLLGKLLQLCYGINGFSDTRIFAAVLLEQLDVILDSINAYVCFYHIFDEDKYILDLMEDYIRESVYALDAYAQYIRNNNLQSLQTPNYNIESNASMEKLLIGYSEFLRTFIEFYQKEQGKAEGREEEQDILHKYLPIVVPALHKRDMSVEVLFPEGKMKDWDKEKERKRNDRYCMVINVPALSELGNVHTTVTALFHEVAHQFRYETRAERNDALLKYTVHKSVRSMVNMLIDKIDRDTDTFKRNPELGKMLEETFLEVYLSVNYEYKSGKLQYPFRNAPLNNLIEHLKSDTSRNLSYWGDKEKIACIIREYVRKLAFWYQETKSRCPDVLKFLHSMPDKIMRQDKDEDGVEETIRCAFCFAMECACHCLDITKERIWEENSLAEWVGRKEQTGLYYEEWKRYFGKDMTAEPVCGDIWDIFQDFALRIYSDINSENILDHNSEKRDQFLKRSYESVCGKWKDDYETFYREGSSLEALGRNLGIDCNTEENFQVFQREIVSVIEPYIMDMTEWQEWYIDKYREETADFFMCNAMKLEPLGYLNVLAVNWPDGRELSEEHIGRILNVLLFQWCCDGEELKYEKFMEISASILEEVKRSILLLAQKKGKEFNELKKTAVWEADTEAAVLEILDLIQSWDRICREIRTGKEKGGKTSESEQELLRLCEYVLKIMGQITDRAKGQIEHMNTYSELKEDYIRGVNRLSGLNQKMCGDENELVRYIGNFSCLLSERQNKPRKFLEDLTKCEELNGRCIDFFLTMYFANKRRVASEICRPEGGR